MRYDDDPNVAAKPRIRSYTRRIIYVCDVRKKDPAKSEQPRIRAPRWAYPFRAKQAEVIGHAIQSVYWKRLHRWLRDPWAP